jgi:thiol-disulfide isomerase/thioredoxin
MVSLVAGLSLHAADEEKSPKEELRALAIEYNQAAQSAIDQIKEATDDARKVEAWGRYRQLPGRFAGRFAAFADRNAKDPELAFDALVWIVVNAPATAEASRAAERLAKDHLQNKKLGELLPAQTESPFASSEKLIRLVRQAADTPNRQGRSALFLAQLLKNKYDLVESLNQADDPELKRKLELQHGKELVRRLADTDPGKLRKEAEGLLDEVLTKHADIKVGTTTLGKLAVPELFELRRLMIGKTIPDIESEDIDGKRFALKDYRGKVVVLVFWGAWCGPCRAMLPHEKALVKRMEGKPFALIGINSDENRDRLKLFLEQDKITWRQVCEGSTHGPIASQWNVKIWPTLYVVDARGVIRAKNARGEKLDEVVNRLVKEADNR